MKTNKKFLSIAVACGLASVSNLTQAAGFQLAEYSATGLGRAYAGEAAIADNAGSQWRNPAMLTYLKGTQISAGALYVNPNVDVEGDVSFYGSTSSTSSSDYANDAVIPNFYISHQVNEKWALGLAFGTNYGMETELDSGFAASHFGDEAMVTTMEANANIAYQLTETVSIGGGIRYVMGEGHFGAKSPAQTEALGLTKGTTLKYMEGDDTSWGWQAGAAWQMTPNNRVGFAYKSEVDLKLSGSANMYVQSYGKVLSDTGYMMLTLPATAELSTYHQLTDQFALHTSINWTDWSSFEKLQAELDTMGTVMVKEENWKDNYRFAVGATYQVDPKLALRSGVAYDTAAVSTKNRTITIPETDRIWLSVGAGYDVTEQLTLDAAFTYIFAKDADILESRGYDSDNSAEKVGGQFDGQMTGNVWIVGVQASYRF
ncbi:outer membrane protein transport protein [Vibrio fluvialis]|jgi:long-chain fatty acid transport protein|uniref:outer membrane protein transport protein n=1 Tax=Vibrio TaxID=662 RepID=UPI00096BC2E5|nr:MULTISPECIES: outer membrane protein transport protein [Vibrio]HDM8033047.1 outer membrane protein transport protein [Vibrio fluvialis clinical-1]EKO3388770.1 outer membrane protein transport protein [Vibrio fluvialis]EKO3395632.1 outer membrane protein transport protein [Vibrio fluvialis]EKO3414090.1 outer membrane protein transport protein [Vibrio fluvialis]EKO3422717.1 outer membrane protein transport protein [Vibrio fluvialis]